MQNYAQFVSYKTTMFWLALPSWLLMVPDIGIGQREFVGITGSLGGLCSLLLLKLALLCDRQEPSAVFQQKVRRALQSKRKKRATYVSVLRIESYLHWKLFKLNEESLNILSHCGFQGEEHLL